MKKTILILSLIILVSGCAFIEARKADWNACKADAKCSADAKKWQETGEVIGGTVGSAFPGAAMPAQKIGGYALLALAMLLGGHAITGVPKKKETT